MDNGCSSLLKIPDLSKWNNNNIKKQGMFNGCTSLLKTKTKGNTYNQKK